MEIPAPAPERIRPRTTGFTATVGPDKMTDDGAVIGNEAVAMK